MIAASSPVADRHKPTHARPRTDRDQRRDRVMRELSRLDRLIIILYYYEQLSAREVGLVLDLPEQQIETRRAALAPRLAKAMA